MSIVGHNTTQHNEHHEKTGDVRSKVEDNWKENITTTRREAIVTKTVTLESFVPCRLPLDQVVKVSAACLLVFNSSPLFFLSCSSQVENRGEIHGSSGYGLHDSDTDFPRGSYHENHCFYTTWLLAVQKKQIWFARDSRGRYLDRRTLHDEGTFVVEGLPSHFSSLRPSTRRPMMSLFTVLLSERSVLRDRIYGCDP